MQARPSEGLPTTASKSVDLASQTKILADDALSQDLIQGTFGLLVPEAGLEPALPCGKGILSRELGGDGSTFC